MKEKSKEHGEKRFLFGLDRPKIEKLIHITSVVAAINHIMVSVWVIIYNIGVPSARGLDIYLCLFLIAELLLLFYYIRSHEETWKQSIKALFKSYFTKDQLLLSFLPVWYAMSLVVTLLLDGSIKNEDNLKFLLDIIINVFVIYPIGRYYFKNRISKLLEIVLHIVVIGMTCYIIYVLFHVFRGEVLTTYFRGKIGVLRLDCVDHIEYHLQVNSHHNTTGAFAALFTLISICMSVWKQGFFRIIYLCAAFIHGIALILSNSRSTFLSACVFITLLLGVIIFFSVKHRFKDGKLVRGVITLVLVIAVFILLIMLRKAVFRIYESCTSIQITENVVIDGSRDVISESVGVENISRDLDVSNLMGREYIWAYAVEGMVISNRNLLVGVTPVGVGSVIYELSNGQFSVYSHNQILEIGLGLGAPAMIIFVFWLILLANRCTMIGFASEERMNLMQRCIPLIVLFLVMFNMFEAILFFYNTFVGGVFMLTAGWCFEAARFGNVAENRRFMGILMRRKKIKKNII
ncbi:MAG: O-antigen ligase family protein [Lachnospiraceae bacterium]|nr:O-antigen ligase family protein [Lachnospiraceae bacterium]